MTSELRAYELRVIRTAKRLGRIDGGVLIRQLAASSDLHDWEISIIIKELIAAGMFDKDWDDEGYCYLTVSAAGVAALKAARR